MTKINDATFGELRHDGHAWIGSVQLVAFLKPLELRVSGFRHQPPDAEKQCVFQQFLERQASLRASLTAAISDFYTTNLEANRNWRTPEAAAIETPALHAPEEIWSLVTPSHVNVAAGPDGPPMVSIPFDASWDTEHGIDVSFYDDKIGLGDGGSHWLDNTHYTLSGERIETRG
jgi:hypothetical protein